jgi:hypothetical protein
MCLQLFPNKSIAVCPPIAIADIDTAHGGQFFLARNIHRSVVPIYRLFHNLGSGFLGFERGLAP